MGLLVKGRRGNFLYERETSEKLGSILEFVMAMMIGIMMVIVLPPKLFLPELNSYFQPRFASCWVAVVFYRRKTAPTLPHHPEPAPIPAPTPLAFRRVSICDLFEN